MLRGGRFRDLGVPVGHVTATLISGSFIAASFLKGQPPGQHPRRLLGAFPCLRYHRLMEDWTSAQDQALLNALVEGKRSGADLSKVVGGLLTPEEAQARAHQLLQGDYIDLLMELQLVLWKARGMITRIEDDWDNEVKGSGKLLLDALKFISTELKEREAMLNGVQVRFDEKLIQAIVEAIKHMALTLAVRYDLPKAELDEIVIEAVPGALAVGSG